MISSYRQSDKRLPVASKVSGSDHHTFMGLNESRDRINQGTLSKVCKYGPRAESTPRTAETCLPTL